MKNKVFLFSNGIANFQKAIELGEGKEQEFSVPVKNDHLGDILTSLDLHGNARFKSPPIYANASNLDGNLNIDAGNAIESLIGELAGAKVSIELHSGTKIVGTLVGRSVERVFEAGQVIERKYVVVQTTDGYSRHVLSDINRLDFTDEVVKTEINKALKRSFSRIKADTTLVNFSVIGKGVGVLEYSVPNPAWKISYRLELGDAPKLKAFAVVDNDTEDDWTDVEVSVTTGEPNTFSTDLAETKIPQRSRVNVVKDRVAAAPEAGRGKNVRAKSMSMRGGAAACAAPMMASMGLECAGNIPSAISCSMPGYPSDDGSSLMQYAGGDANLDIFYQADVKEVGDFSIFTAKEAVTIPAHSSAVIPIFETDLEGNSVVYYQTEKPEKAFSSVQIQNNSEYSWSRGSCVVNEAAVYAGQCIVPMTKSGEERFLPYAVQTAVHVNPVPTVSKTRLSSFQLSNGAGVVTNELSQISEFEISNLKNEEYKFVFDYTHLLSKGSDRKVELQSKDGGMKLEVDKALDNGSRYTFVLAPKQDVTIKIVEKQIQKQQIVLDASRLHWFVNSYVNNDGPLSDCKEIKTALKYQDQISELNQQISLLNAEVVQLTARQDQTRKNLAVPGLAGTTDGIDWQKDLSKRENRITQIQEKEVPSLNEKMVETQKKLDAILKSLVFETKSK